MLALTFQGEKTIELVEVPVPTILRPTDCIVKVLLCSICGSDLHPFHGRETGIVPGTVVGHEFVGVVHNIGAGVKHLNIGDRVASPFTTCCGACFYCTKGVTCRCEHPEAHLFGWNDLSESDKPAELRRGLHGSQAQYVRVPLADATLVKVPEEITNEEAILLGDILSTAFFCAENGSITPGSEVAVVGCGPVGLLAIMAAQHYGAGKVWAVDCVPARLEFAASLGAIPLNFTQADAVAAVKASTSGHGADVVLEVVGGQGSGLQLAFDLVRPCGCLSSVGVHTSSTFPFSPVQAYNKNVTFKSGRCPARSYMQKLMGVVLEHKHPFTSIITHRLSLQDGARGYEMFDKKLDNCLKVVLDPWK